MLLVQAHLGQNSCRPYSQRVPGTHLSMDLFPDIHIFRWIFFDLRITKDKSMYVPDLFLSQLFVVKR